jgi:hypothetical protein
LAPAISDDTANKVNACVTIFLVLFLHLLSPPHPIWLTNIDATVRDDEPTSFDDNGSVHVRGTPSRQTTVPTNNSGFGDNDWAVRWKRRLGIWHPATVISLRGWWDG